MCHRAAVCYYVVLSVNLHNGQPVVLKQLCLWREENAVVTLCFLSGGGIMLRRLIRCCNHRWFLSLRAPPSSAMKPGASTPISNLCPWAKMAATHVQRAIEGEIGGPDHTHTPDLQHYLFSCLNLNTGATSQRAEFTCKLWAVKPL